MSAHNATAMGLFGVEGEVVSLLRCPSNDELRTFAESQNSSTSEEQVEHYIRLFFFLFTETRAKEFLEQAIQRADAWIAAVDNPDLALRLKIYNLMTAVKTQLSLTAGDHGYDRDYHIMHLCKRAEHLRMTYQRTNAVNDLNDAISAMEQAGKMRRESQIGHPSILSDLSVMLGMRFERTGSLDDLNRAVDNAGQAADTIPQDHPDRASRLSNLGAWLGMRFKRIGTMDDLNRAIDVAGQAVEATPQNCLNRAGRLNNLGILLGTRFERIGSIDDLNRAVDATSQAVDATPRDHPDRAGLLSSLGTRLGRRFERIGSMDDLNRAVDIAGQAADATPQGHLDRAGRLSNLGSWLGTRFERNGSMEDLSRAIDVAGQAVDATTQDHPDRATPLSNLGNVLGIRFKTTGSMEDLSRAIDVAGRAVDATPKDHPDRATTLSNLGILLGMRFERINSVDDLNGAIDVTGQAVEATPQDHPDRASRLSNLGAWLGARCKRTLCLDDLNRQLSTYRDGWHCHTANPSIRIRLARHASRILAALLDWEGSSQLLQEAVKLLPSIGSRWLKHTDKQHMLADFAGLASEAASTVLNAQQTAYDALRLLELGRGIIASLLMEMRGDTSDLRKQHPDLADEFISCRDHLDSPGDSPTLLTCTNDASSWESQAQQRREASLKFEKLIVKIRAQPGFQNFLLPPTTDELMAAASLGPVIVINLSPYRCDAFLIETNQIQVLELPELTLRGVQERAQKLRSVPQAATYDATPLLEWLWDVVARPVLDALGFDGPIVDDNWPHVWWVPTGVLSQLPLHAAGYHGRGGHETVIDRVMSSYASSAKALIYGRRYEMQRSIGPLCGEALLVGMRETPDLTANRMLSFVTDEIEIVQNLCPSLGLRPMRPTPCKDDVLKHLQACRIFHFSGHGQSDPDEPSRSCLLLEDWKSDPLTVGDLREHRLQETPPFLGFLSACSTGANKVDRLVDEGIHLVSAFQLAGFRHVVGTLWEVSDQHCVDVARVLYETMRDEGMTDVAVCRGLHRAIRALRNGDSGTRTSGRSTSPTRSEDFSGRTEVAEAGYDDINEMARGGVETLVQTRGQRDPGRVKRKKGKYLSLFWVPYVHFGV